MTKPIQSRQAKTIDTCTVDYGFGPQLTALPHVWNFERPVDWEGPAIYRFHLDVPAESCHLRFHGVSYAAEIRVGDALVLTHHGIWDAFDLDLSPWMAKTIVISVTVVKNGGRTYPVKQVASGFLPYVYQTFGGIFRPVELILGLAGASEPSPIHRVSISSGTLFVDGQRYYARGILSWGWYPKTASPHPTVEAIREEVEQIRLAGFNLVKFCLWMPPHEYLEELDRRGLMAWLELPIWLPATDAHSLDCMRAECLRIVEQYRHHPNILAWTAGCELSEGIEPNWRNDLVRDIQRLTGHPMVKDNSGGAEMYGGHPAEFGTFDDFHPYCEPNFYPLVLDSLNAGPRATRPTLLGEFNDYDVYRPINKLAANPPYWASPDPDLNAQGVRWQYDLPRIIVECNATERALKPGSEQSLSLAQWLESRSDDLESSSKSQGAWMRQSAFDATRLNLRADGWVLTGHRHTPISTAGIVDDDGKLVFSVEETRRWTEDVSLLLFPRRTPPWINGGNRPGWEHPTVRFAGPCLFQVAVHSVHAITETLFWTIEDVSKSVIGSGRCESGSLTECVTKQVGAFTLDLIPGQYSLTLNFGAHSRTWQIQVCVPLGEEDSVRILDSTHHWGLPDDPHAEFWIGCSQSAHGRGLRIAPAADSIAKPMFRECCYSWDDEPWAEFGWKNNWSLLSLVVGEHVLNQEWLDQTHRGWRPMLTRLDTRTFERHPVLVRQGQTFITTLHPQGGQGIQPTGIPQNPAGLALLRSLRGLAQS